jgi:cell division protein FtsW (lipid II flippase)
MSGYNPYQAPAYPPPGYPAPGYPPAKYAHVPPGTPGAWWFFVAYCVFMGLLYLICVGIGGALIAFAEEIARDDPEATPMQMTIMGIAFSAISLPLMILFFSAPLLPKRKWAWIVCIVAICIGLTSACTMIASIPLLIFWLKDDVKCFYRV